jgi:hypothetical protein
MKSTTTIPIFGLCFSLGNIECLQTASKLHLGPKLALSAVNVNEDLSSAILQPPNDAMESDTDEGNSENSCYPVHTLLLCRHGDSIWNGGQPGVPETFT